jgi:hypothetical protein
LRAAREALGGGAHVKAGPDLDALHAAQGPAVGDAQALRLRGGEAARLAVERVELVEDHGQVALRGQQAVRPDEERHEAHDLRGLSVCAGGERSPAAVPSAGQ